MEESVAIYKYVVKVKKIQPGTMKYPAAGRSRELLQS